MNVVFLDPTYIDAANLTRLGEILKIRDVYCCMPMIRGDYKIKNSFGAKVKLWRRTGETLENVTKRAVYALLNMVSKPIFVDGNFIERKVYEIFVDSNVDSFSSNLNLDDPNILILYPDHRLDSEECNVKFFRYFFNILKKYDNTNRYNKRIASTKLSPFICLNDTTKWELQDSIKSDDSFNSLKNNAQLLLHLLTSYGCNSISDLRNILLTSQGEHKRIEVLNDIEEEDRKQREEAQAYYNDGLTEAQRWGADAEMDYIRNNGGDWIDG